MKLIIAVLLAAVVVMAAFLSSQSARTRELERAIQQLNSKLVERTTSASLELQGKCSEQARKAFADLGHTKNQLAGYENHYNSQMNKCFIHVQNTDTKMSPGTIWRYRNVFDAFEGKEYGTYAWRTEKAKKYWEVPAVECEVTLPSGEKKLCHSDGEFTDLVKVYMEGGR
jgi:hypothetical protein